MDVYVIAQLRKYLEQVNSLFVCLGVGHHSLWQCHLHPLTPALIREPRTLPSRMTVTCGRGSAGAALCWAANQAGAVSNATWKDSESGTEKLSFSNPIT